MAVFVDTGAWFANFVRRDPDHPAAVAWMRKNRQPLVTTDYVLDELLTLLKLRESYRVAVAAGEALWRQRVARLEHITHEDVARAW
ncbi:MAG: PIN domain-containing protein, partial [Deltaproteobacteria bacterium]|nr:PIN domain-containing protein [Deltaproteobacteria bacterium]